VIEELSALSLPGMEEVNVDAMSGVSIASFVSDPTIDVADRLGQFGGVGAKISVRVGINSVEAMLFNQRILVMPRRMKRC
jgi:hypothetical protein